MSFVFYFCAENLVLFIFHMKKILIVVGTRPNFIKVTRFNEIAQEYVDMEVKLVHTGQHYDRIMSGVFFEQFRLQPDYFLGLEARTPAAQIGEMIMKLGKLIEEYKPSLVMVPGDVNSTLAGALATHKAGIPLAHLESGLRSFDRTMPEEINRILTDEITDWFYVTEQSGMDNLLREGKATGQIHMVGNTMIDTLVAFDGEIQASDILEKLQLTVGDYFLLTMHRPRIVDNMEGLQFLLQLVKDLSEMGTTVFPIHPRTKKNIAKFGLEAQFEAIPRLIQSAPMDYFSFQKLIAHARLILTDSGGIQEESTFKQIPCMTLRENTERPVTVTLGTNELLPFDPDLILNKVAAESFKTGEIPPFWDGNSTARILAHLNEVL